jgi:NAD+--asparagine ADP-ribosyltransferase
MDTRDDNTNHQNLLNRRKNVSVVIPYIKNAVGNVSENSVKTQYMLSIGGNMSGS